MEEIDKEISNLEYELQCEIITLCSRIQKSEKNKTIYLNDLKRRIEYLKWINKKFNMQFKSTGIHIYQQEIFYCELGYNLGSEQNNRRPVVVLQNNIGNEFGETTIIAPVTTYENSSIIQNDESVFLEYNNKKGEKVTKKLDFYEVPLEIEDGYQEKIVGIVNVVHTREISKKRIVGKHVAKVTDDNFKNIINALIKNFEKYK